ncbi:MAG: DUF3617 domain-containing protein [Sphingomicrobium sp.]
MRLVTIMLATAALAACNKAPEVELTNASPQEVANKMKESGVASEMRQPGLWATTIELVDFQAPGMPPEMLSRMRTQMGSGQKQERCVTKEEVEKLDAFIGQNNANCVFEKYKVSAGQIDGKATCKPGGMTQTMTMKGTYSKTKSDMTMTSELTGAPPPMGNAKTIMNVKSERVGDCDAKTAAG